MHCNAPTNDKDEETKENLYNRLQTLRDKLKEKDMPIRVEDVNAKINVKHELRGHMHTRTHTHASTHARTHTQNNTQAT